MLGTGWRNRTWDRRNVDSVWVRLFRFFWSSEGLLTQHSCKSFLVNPTSNSIWCCIVALIIVHIAFSIYFSGLLIQIRLNHSGTHIHYCTDELSYCHLQLLKGNHHRTCIVLRAYWLQPCCELSCETYRERHSHNSISHCREYCTSVCFSWFNLVITENA